jgi:hypothetical protein
MALPLKTDLPPDLDLAGGWTIEWDAVDPTDGSAVTGVTVSNVSVLIEPVAGGVPTAGEVKLANPLLIRQA